MSSRGIYIIAIVHVVFEYEFIGTIDDVMIMMINLMMWWSLTGATEFAIGVTDFAIGATELAAKFSQTFGFSPIRFSLKKTVGVLTSLEMVQIKWHPDYSRNRFLGDAPFDFPFRHPQGARVPWQAFPELRFLQEPSPPVLSKLPKIDFGVLYSWFWSCP